MDTIQKMIQEKMTEMAMEKMGKSFGLDKSKTSGIIAVALPLIMAALAKNAASKTKAVELDTALAKDHDGSILDRLEDMMGDANVTQDGSKILGHVFGDNLEDVTKTVSQSAGADQRQVSDVMGNLAPVILGQLGKQKKDQNLDVDSLTELLKGDEVESKNKLGGFMALLDRDGDGEVMDDILELGRGLFSTKK